MLRNHAPHVGRLLSSSKIALLPIVLVAATACSEVAGPEQTLSGEQIYQRQCARCHGVDGRPTKAAPTARDLTNRSYIDSLGDRKIREAIMQGRPAMAPPGQAKTMPSFGGQFSEPELKVLIGYVRSLSNPELGPSRLSPDAVRTRETQ